VKKYLWSDETEPTHTKRISPSKLDPYAKKPGRQARNRDNKIAETAAQSQADLHKRRFSSFGEMRDVFSWAMATLDSLVWID